VKIPRKILNRLPELKKTPINWVAVIAVVFSIGVYFNGSVNDKINDRFNDPRFVKQVAEQIRLPFIIFDERGTYICDTGSSKYIASIHIIPCPKSVSSSNLTIPPCDQQNMKEIREIIITSNIFLVTPPILQNLNGQLQFYEPVRTGKRSFKYKAFYPFEHVVTLGAPRNPPPPPSLLFKLDVIPND
jgi:hypothetical protein